MTTTTPGDNTSMTTHTWPQLLTDYQAAMRLSRRPETLRTRMSYLTRTGVSSGKRQVRRVRARAASTATTIRAAVRAAVGLRVSTAAGWVGSSSGTPPDFT